MNDHELHYLHYARSRELIAEAERAREAQRVHKAAKAERRERLAARVGKAFGRKEERPAKAARRLQTAK
ncbi:hypothetical protein [Glycomyces tenuis]|uniref:hypothetical protein n=1 Tax=Glycomyces tenuis TaxID=58116 RepID=UPI000419CEF3|nr:hypothetical protein [Glycomyces tenuis]